MLGVQIENVVYTWEIHTQRLLLVIDKYMADYKVSWYPQFSYVLNIKVLFFFKTWRITVVGRIIEMITCQIMNVTSFYNDAACILEKSEVTEGWE